MEISNGESEFDDEERMKELKAFDNTRLGVKGLVDAGAQNIPKMFVRLKEELAEDDHYYLDHLKNTNYHSRLPVIDLEGLLLGNGERRKIVDQARLASENWGFFKVVNHGIPVTVLDNMIARVRKFNEQDVDAKKEYYTRDRTRNVRFNSNYDLFQSKRVDWRDTLTVSMLTSDHVDPNEFPLTCRDTALEFIDHVTKVGDILFGLLSEALGLKPDHLRSMQCNEGRFMNFHYYPECPEPELAMGATKHTDNTFLTILAQDQTGGLQVLHQNQWVDVDPTPGALAVNIGDLLQIASNDKFKSVVHRVLPSRAPRVSAVCFFVGQIAPPSRLYGPIKELLSEENPPKFREVLATEHHAKFYSKALHEKPNPDNYRL